MSDKSKTECINDNDYKEAIYRYENTSKRWQSYWWDCIQTIYSKCKEFAEKYILDIVNKEVVKLVKKIKSKKIEGSNTYFIKIFDNYGNWVYNKIGKGNDLIKRLNQQIGHTYKEGVTFGNYEIIKSYNLPTDDLALVLESFMRNYFRKNHDYVPNDRFYAFEPTEEDLINFENYYNLVMENA